MKIYQVGGAVRDALLGLPVKDRDWVVVGATPERMAELGYRPVGRDFPVFLHPETQEEYALARTERKTARGYRGFEVSASPDVTLEQDLQRRDLTINAMACDDDGTLIDPHGGQRDLQARVLRHVGEAFEEDPVRILRLARFAARFSDFTVAPETQALMRRMVDVGEADHLVPERVWQELSRGLMEQRPSRMFDVLRGCGALAQLLPELDRLWGVPQRPEFHPEVDTGVHVMMVIDYAAERGCSLGVRFAALVHDLGKGTTPVEVLPGHAGHEHRSVQLLEGVCARLRVPVEVRELARTFAAEHGNIHRASQSSPAALVRLLERCDAFRKPARFAEVLLAAECDWRGRLGNADRPYPPPALLGQALALAAAVDSGAVAARVTAADRDVALSPTERGTRIRARIHEERVGAVRRGLAAAATDAMPVPAGDTATSRPSDTTAGQA